MEEKTLPKLSLTGVEPTSGIRGDNEAVEAIVISVMGGIEPTSRVRGDNEEVEVLVVSIMGVESTCGGPGDDSRVESSRPKRTAP